MNDHVDDGQPRRAHTLILSVGADTAGDLAHLLRHMAFQVEAGRLSQGVFGGPRDGGHYSYQHDPAMTHDAYFTAIDEWLETRAAGKGKGAGDGRDGGGGPGVRRGVGGGDGGGTGGALGTTAAVKAAGE